MLPEMDRARLHRVTLHGAHARAVHAVDEVGCGGACMQLTCGDGSPWRQLMIVDHQRCIPGPH